MHFLQKVLPILNWLPNYKKGNAKHDLFAGLTIGILLIPQGMAYALIAGLPPVYGLYASIVPQIVYSFLGTSRQLSVAPVAMDSLLLASGISVLATEGSKQYIVFAILVASLMGIFQILLGLFRMGFITNLLSKPVISGFTSAAALIISINQLNHLLGISIHKSNNTYSLLLEIVNQLSYTHWVTLIIGITGILLIIVSKKIHKNLPGSLIAVIVGTIVVYSLGLSNKGVSIIGEIPRGLPSFSLPNFSMNELAKLTPLALTIAVISFMEAFSISKAMETKTKNHKIVPNQELIALGASNFIGSLFSSYPVTGGFSRSAVSYQTGGKTQMTSIISASLIATVLLFFTDLFYYLPKAILASIIMVAVYGLIDLSYPRRLWKTNKAEFSLLLATAIMTLTIGIVAGITAGIILSIILFLYKSAYPHIAKLGKVKGYHEYRNIKRFKELEEWENILILRHDAPLTFINIQHFKDFIESEVALTQSTEYIIIDAAPISHIDASASDGLRDLLHFLSEKKIQLLLTDVIGPVRDVLQRNGLNKVIGDEHIFIDINEAVRFATTQNEGRYKKYALQSDSTT